MNCSVANCVKKYKGLGYCGMHYQRFKKNGHLIAAPRQYHGLKQTPEYEAWCGMKKRCYNKNEKQFKDYGGRGITVCDRWLHDFLQFYTDMGKRPDRTMSLDRINVDGNYSPENCRWTTGHIQAINSRIKNTNTSGYRGVAWYEPYNKWVAQIYFEGNINLGYFCTKEEAALMYDCAAIQLRGYEAKLNLL